MSPHQTPRTPRSVLRTTIFLISGVLAFAVALALQSVTPAQATVARTARINDHRGHAVGRVVVQVGGGQVNAYVESLCRCDAVVVDKVELYEIRHATTHAHRIAYAQFLADEFAPPPFRFWTPLMTATHGYDYLARGWMALCDRDPQPGVTCDETAPAQTLRVSY
jgi:hypothetical protein